MQLNPSLPMSSSYTSGHFSAASSVPVSDSHASSSTSSSNVTAEINSLNPVKVRVAQQAFQQTMGLLLPQFRALQISSNIDQPIGLIQTQQEAVRRLGPPNSSLSKMKIVYSMSLVNGLVPGKELSSFFKKKYDDAHWYDIGVLALRVFKCGCTFNYMGYATPLQIPNTEEEGFLPPEHSDGYEKNLLKYQAIILPWIREGKDVYQIFSKSKLSRESALLAIANDSIMRLRAIQIYDFDAPIAKFRTVITCGTFDYFHEMHKKVINRGLKLGTELVVYVYGKDTKRKDETIVQLSDSVQERIEKVTKYALEANEKSKVTVQRMQQKHLKALAQAFALHAKNGSVALLGGEDQFSSYPEVLDLCFKYHVPIITANRGDEGSAMCSSDLRRRESYVRISNIHDVNLENCSTSFWKKDFPTVRDAQVYIKEKMPLLGSDATEQYEYNESFIVDRKVVKPVFESGKMVIVLPGRTGCDIDRVRKVLATVKDTLSSLPGNVHYYLTCYQQTKETTEYYIDELETAPFDYFSDDAMLVTKLLLMSRVSKDIVIEKNENTWSVKTLAGFEKPSVDDLKSRFLDVTLWGRSRGAVIALEIENAFRFCLLALDYSELEILDIGKQIGVVSISNLASLDRGRIFSTISFTGTNDKKALKYIRTFSERVSELNIGGVEAKPHFLSSSHLAFFAQIPQLIRTYTGNSDPANYFKEITVEDPDRHYTPLFLAHRIDGDNTIPTLIKRTLEHMIFRSEKFLLKQLISRKLVLESPLQGSLL